MRCDEVKKLISPYLDSELDSLINFSIEEHLEACQSCQKYFEKEHHFETSLKSALVTGCQETQEAWEKALDRATQTSGVRIRRPLAIAVSMMIIFLVVGGWMQSGFYQSDLAWAAYKNHTKYLEDKMPVDIQSTQAGEVNEFFKGKLAFNVNVPKGLSDPDIRMVGAKICHLKEAPVAYMVYHCKNKPVSLFSLGPDQAGHFKQLKDNGDGIQKDTFFGKTTITYKKGDKIICVVSEDVPDETLKELVLAYANTL